MHPVVLPLNVWITFISGSLEKPVVCVVLSVYFFGCTRIFCLFTRSGSYLLEGMVTRVPSRNVRLNVSTNVPALLGSNEITYTSLTNSQSLLGMSSIDTSVVLTVLIKIPECRSCVMSKLISKRSPFPFVEDNPATTVDNTDYIMHSIAFGYIIINCIWCVHACHKYRNDNGINNFVRGLFQTHLFQSWQ
jgi:hypothetical protein